MYSKQEIKEIVKKNKFSTEVCHSWDDSCLIVVPNFQEYKFLFGNGKTRLCYAHEERYWEQYHSKNSRQVDFLSLSHKIDKQYQHITCCLNVNMDKIDWEKYNKGETNIISGNLTIHDSNHYLYSFKFMTTFHKTCMCDLYVNEENMRVDFDINICKNFISTSLNFIDFCKNFSKRGLLPLIVKEGCLDILKEHIKK
jgi:hypothetical protein